MVVLVGFVHNTMMRFYMVVFVGFVHNAVVRLCDYATAVLLYMLVGTLARQRGGGFKG